MPLTSPNWLDRVSKGGMSFFPMAGKAEELYHFWRFVVGVHPRNHKQYFVHTLAVALRGQRPEAAAPPTPRGYPGVALGNPDSMPAYAKRLTCMLTGG